MQERKIVVKKREILFTVAGILLSLLFFWIYLYKSTYTILTTFNNHSTLGALEHLVFLILAVALIYGSFIYLFMRLGRLDRNYKAVHPGEKEIDNFIFIFNPKYFYNVYDLIIYNKFLDSIQVVSCYSS